MEEEIKEEISRDKYSIPDEKETFFSSCGQGRENISGQKETLE